MYVVIYVLKMKFLRIKTSFFVIERRKSASGIHLVFHNFIPHFLTFFTL